MSKWAKSEMTFHQDDIAGPVWTGEWDGYKIYYLEGHKQLRITENDIVGAKVACFRTVGWDDVENLMFIFIRTKIKRQTDLL